jgi:hypothetical protein
MYTSPLVGSRNPATMLRVVVFPEPLRPEQGQELARAYREIHIAHRHDVAEAVVDAGEPYGGSGHARGRLSHGSPLRRHVRRNESSRGRSSAG